MEEQKSKQSVPEYIIQIYAKSKALSVEPYTGDKDCERYITVDEAITICEGVITKAINLNEARAHIKEWGIDENAYIMANLKNYLDSNENIDDNSNELSEYHQHCLEIVVNNRLQ